MAKMIKTLMIIIILCFGSFYLLAQESQSNTAKTETTETDLSNINWDEEEPKAETKSDDFSDINWDEESTQESTETADFSETNWGENDEKSDGTEDTEDYFDTPRESREEIEKREGIVHLWGFLLFVVYILGGAYTAYFTRDRKLAVHYPPELLILLHTVWPVEWLCLIFAGKKVR